MNEKNIIFVCKGSFKLLTDTSISVLSTLMSYTRGISAQCTSTIAPSRIPIIISPRALGIVGPCLGRPDGLMHYP